MPLGEVGLSHRLVTAIQDEQDKLGNILISSLQMARRAKHLRVAVESEEASFMTSGSHSVESNVALSKELIQRKL
jgi:hypothetical protein